MVKQQVNLIDLNASHLDLLYNWRNQQHIREVMYNRNEIAYSNHQKWFTNILQSEDIYYKILTVNQVPFGVANFRYTNKKDSVGEWGFYIGELEAQKGMGTILCSKMLDFLFFELNVRKICAEVLSFNERSLKFHEKMGFKKEGILKKHLYRDDAYIDVHLFGIFKNEWNMTRDKLNSKNR